ncbi:MAG: roadblock/LC7 domain-containing protein [Candidatus Micrarchaeota archaeon]|nr:roadblock/LC7 domain-containing protein [Candidatus Micrarchaeota archaeon]
MRKRAALSVLLALMLILLSGCVERSVPIVSQKPSIEKATTSDVDGDTIPDVWYYKLRDQSVVDTQSGNDISMRKEVYIRGTEKNTSFQLQNYYRRNETRAEALYARLSAVSTLSLQCTYAIEEVVPCDSETQCTNLCLSKPRCLNGLNKFPQLNGTFYQLSVDLVRTKSQASALKKLIAETQSATEADLGVILGKRDELLASIDKLLAAPVFQENLCNANEFIMLQGALYTLDSVYPKDESAIKAQYYFAYSRYEVSVKTSFTYDENAVIEVDEVIPQQFARGKQDVSFIIVPRVVSESTPVVARYRLSFTKGDRVRDDIAYKSETGPHDWDSVMQSVAYPAGTAKVLELEGIPAYVAARDTFVGITGQLRPTTGLAWSAALGAFAFLLPLYLLLVALRLLFEAFKCISAKEPLVEAVYRVAGHGGRNRLQILAFALIMSAIGTYLTWNAGEPEGFDVVQVLLSDNTQLVAAACMLTGLFSAYFIVADVLKGIALGARYFRAPITQGIRKVLVEKELREEIQKMRSDMLALKERAQAVGLAFDTARTDAFLAALGSLEAQISQGDIDGAESRMGREVRNEYTSLHQSLSVALEESEEIAHIRESLEPEISRIEDLYGQAAVLQLKIDRKNWREEANAYRAIAESQGLAAAKRHLEAVSQHIKQDYASLSSLISVCKDDKLFVEGLRERLQPDIERLESLYNEAESLGIPIERKNVRALVDKHKDLIELQGYSAARKYLESVAQQVQREYSAAMETITLNREERLQCEAAYQRAEQQVAAVEEAYSQASLLGIAHERKNWRAELAKYKDIASSKGYRAARMHLESVSSSLQQEYSSLRDRIFAGRESASAIESLRKSLEQQVMAVEDLYARARSYGIDVKPQDWRAEIAAYKGIAESKGLTDARKYLEGVSDRVSREHSALALAVANAERLKRELAPALFDKIRSMRSDIEALKQAAVSAGIEVDFGGVAAFLRSLSDAEALISSGRPAEAEQLVNGQVRANYNALREQLSLRIDQEKILSNEAASVEDELDAIESLYARASAAGIEYEPPALRQALYGYRDLFQSKGFAEAKRQLDQLLKSAKEERARLESIISKAEGLMKVRFACPICSRITSLASDKCQSCGVPLEEGFSARYTDLRHELDAVASELREKKISGADRVLASADVLLSHLLEGISKKKFDKAAELLPAISEKVRHLKGQLAAAQALEAELGASIQQIESLAESIPKLMFEASEAGVDVSQFERRFNALGGADALAALFELPVDESAPRTRDLLKSYSQLEADVRTALSQHISSMGAFERLNSLSTEVSVLLKDAEDIGIDVSEYKRKIDGLNVEEALGRAASGELGEDAAEGVAGQLSQMKAELEHKIPVVRSLYERVLALDEKRESAQRQVDECSKGGLLPFAEQEALYLVDTGPIKERLARIHPEDAESVSAEIISLERAVDEAVQGLRKKQAVLSAWPSWRESVRSILSKQGRVSPDMLTTVPPEWRPWVLERFVSTSDVPVALQGGELVRLKEIKGVSKADITEIIEEMVSTQRILGGAILRRDGLVISAALPGGRDASSAAALAARAMQKAEQASQSLSRGEVNYVLFNAEQGKVVIVKAGEHTLVMALTKPDEDLGFVVTAMKKAARRAREIIDKL